MSKVREWLKELNLDQYADRFVDNDIDAEVRPGLTDGFLKEVDVTRVRDWLESLDLGQ